MISFVAHGGSCCGVYHFFGFADVRDKTAELDNAFQRWENNVGYIEDDDEMEVPNTQRLIEVVLIDRQLHDGWAPVLRAKGFVPVSRFMNSNSWNICTVFHWHEDRQELDNIPGWGDPLPVIAPPAPVQQPAHNFVVGQRVVAARVGNTHLRQGVVYTVAGVGINTILLSGTWYASHRFNPLVGVQPREVVRTYYINVYRGGDGTGRFDSVEAANSPVSAARRIRVDQVTVYDDRTETRHPYMG